MPHHRGHSPRPTPTTHSSRTPRRRPLIVALSLALLPAALAPQAIAEETPAASAGYQLQLQQRSAKRLGLPSAAPVKATTARGGINRPVTSCADDGTPGTLRSVLGEAGEGDTIDLSDLTCSTITLTQGELDIGVFGDNHVYDLNIVGPGRDLLTLDGNNASRIIGHQAFSGSQSFLRISDLRIANGRYAGGMAGCIVESGTLELTNVDIDNCHSSGGRPLFAAALITGDLVMQSSTVTGSTGTTTSTQTDAVVLGAVYADSAQLVDSVISGNTITSNTGGDGYGYFTAGGGLYVRGDATITRSTISGNTVTTQGTTERGLGGGVFVTGNLAIDSSTLDGNQTDGDGGGVFKARFSPWGDPPVGTTLDIRNSTISSNTAARGGGVSSARPAAIHNSTVAFNDAEEGAGGVLFNLALADNLTFQFESSIIALNTAGTAATLPADVGSTGALTVSGANNLIIDAGMLTVPGDTLDDDPLLAPLGDNGGPTSTHALLAGSPAIDAGHNAAAVAFDQRGEGFPRVAGAAADIGAFEAEAKPISDIIFYDGFELGAEPVVYQLDDGAANVNIGPPSSFDPDMLWGNYFVVEPGGEVITEISVAFGATFPSLANGPVTFWLLEDADADFDPRNAVALTSVTATPNVSGNDFFTVQIPPTQVNGALFVGASAKLLGGQDRPARVDTDAVADRSWFFYAPDIAAVIDNLASAPFGTRMDNAAQVPYPGAFMVRARGEAAD